MKLPPDVIATLEEALEGLHFAKVQLEIVIHDRRLKYRIVTEKSVVPGCKTSGEGENHAA